MDRTNVQNTTLNYQFFKATMVHYHLSSSVNKENISVAKQDILGAHTILSTTYCHRNQLNGVIKYSINASASNLRRSSSHHSIIRSPPPREVWHQVPDRNRKSAEKVGEEEFE